MFFKIDPVISLLPAIHGHGQYIILALSAVTLCSRYFCFKYLGDVKRVIHASDIAKRLSINVFVILWIYL